MVSTVGVEVLVEDALATGRGCVTMLALRWNPRDPFAVALILTSTPDHPALPRGHWVVLRDFLRYGLEEPTGDGAVRIIPKARDGRVGLMLARNGRPTWVTAPAETVRAFLDRTDAVVPAGEERSAEAIDALINVLLRGG